MNRSILALGLGFTASALALTPFYEVLPEERDLAPRSEVVVTNLPVPWPKGADRLFFEIWCADESEEPFSLRVNGGRGKDGKLQGTQAPWGSGIEELPSNGSMLWGIDVGRLKKGLDINALSNVTLKVLSGAPVRFGVSRVFTLAKGEDAPIVEKPVPRHPRDAAEHAADFAAFKEECARGDFVIGWATSMENVRPRGGFKWRKADKVGVRLARGEYESFQILVAPNGHDLKGVTVQVEGDLNQMQNAECRMQNDGAAARQDAAPPIAGRMPAPPETARQDAAPPGGPAAVPAAAGKMPALPGGDGETPSQLSRAGCPRSQEPSNRQTVKPSNSLAATNVAASVVGYTETIHPPPYVVRPPKGGKMKRPPCGWYPDPILDFQKSCDISGNDVQSFWIRVKCPRDQEAGVYEGALVVSAEGAESVRIPFSVRVYDFEVGRVSPLPLAISVSPPGERDPADHWRNDWQKRREEFCDFFADYFITPDQLYCNGAREPYWDMLKRLKDQGRLNMFNLRYMWYMGRGEKGEVEFREKILPVLKARYEKAKELGIEKHAYFYGFDELGANTFSNCYLTVEQLHKEFPGVPVMTTARDPLFGTNGSQLPNIDMHCPATCFWNPAQVERARRDGRKVWWYFCNNPASPFANMTLEGPPCEIRSFMGAQTQKFKPDGFLYYATTHWYAKEPIKEGPFTKWEPRSFGAYHGDGQWTCCGGPDNMPLPTIRLENFRDGVEDLWYVRTLEGIYAGRLTQKMFEDEKVLKEGGEPAGDEWIRKARDLLAVPNEVVRSWSNFSTSPDVIYRWRDEIADLIEESGH